MDTYLAPVEKPHSLLMKATYYFMRRQFGKVPTPVAVGSARLPNAFALFYTKISQLDKKLELPEELVMLLRQQVARLNVCLFCVDINRYYAIQKSMDTSKFDLLDEYRTNRQFSDKERAALDYVTELTTEKKMSRETFERLPRHFSEREICEIVWLVASEHVYNMTNIGLNIHSDMLCDMDQRKRARAAA